MADTGQQSPEIFTQYGNGAISLFHENHSEKSESKVGSVFGPTELFRLRQSLVRLSEEVKRLKSCDKENEEKIKALADKNQSLEKTKDELEQNLVTTKKELENTSNDLMQQYEEKIRRIEVEQKPTDVSSEGSKAVKSKLKAQLGHLQMTTYQQEKTIKELEAKLQSVQANSDTAMQQWSTLDTRLVGLNKLYQSGFESLTRLEESGRSSFFL